jgi:hypothetical protein
MVYHSLLTSAMVNDVTLAIAAPPSSEITAVWLPDHRKPAPRFQPGLPATANWKQMETNYSPGK